MSGLVVELGRAGLITESVLFADFVVVHNASIDFVTESDFEVGLYSVQPASSVDFLSEVVGNITPRAGFPYDPDVIVGPDSAVGIIVFVTESIGSSPDGNILGLTWQFGAGAAYGPQESSGGGGPGGAEYVHTQASALATWTVNHNLGFKPDVYITSTGGVGVMGEVLHVDTDTLLIYFDVPFSGYARCT